MATDAQPSALPDVSKLLVSEVSTPTDDTEWHDQLLHVLVLSNAGKPLFSLHGDEAKLAGLTAVAQALISVVKDMDGDMLHTVRYVWGCIVHTSSSFAHLLASPIPPQRKRRHHGLSGTWPSVFSGSRSRT